MDKVKIGVIGCGNISGIYLDNCVNNFELLEVKAVADLVPEMARKRAEEYGIPVHCSVEQLLADEEIEIVVNLTSPHVHTQVNLQILEAGKHVYTEKPFALSREDADRVMELARSKGLRVGSAPDTFLGAGLQTSRKVIEDGWIGKPYAVGGLIIMGSVWEGKHPNLPSFLNFGWDPLFDMAPYYLTAMVHLFGPAWRVAGLAHKAREELHVNNPKSPHYGKTFPVDAPMNITASIDFESGIAGHLLASKDSFGYTPRLEVYGTEGILHVPDPNSFEGEIRVQRSSGETKSFPYSHGLAFNGRGAGIADMAYGIRLGRPHRASGELASHIIDISQGILESSASGQYVEMRRGVSQPSALPMNLKFNLLDE